MRPSSRTLGSIAAAAALAALTPITQAALITSAGHAALAGASLIDFEGIGTFQTRSFTIGTVSFSGSGDVNLSHYEAVGYPRNGNALQTPYSDRGMLHVDFSLDPVSAFALELWSVDQAYEMAVFGMAGNVLYNSRISQGFYQYVGFAADERIRNVRLRTVAGGTIFSTHEWVLADNLSYMPWMDPAPDPAPDPDPDPDPAPAPAPAAVASPGTFTLLGAALLAWRLSGGRSARRRR
jgi:hypothetical protein